MRPSAVPCLSLFLMSLFGCGASDEPPVNDIVELSITVDGELCDGPCPRWRRGIRAPNLLVIADSTNGGPFETLEFEIRPAEFAAIVDIVRSPEFVAAVQNLECPPKSGSYVNLTITKDDGTTQVYDRYSGCFGPPPPPLDRGPDHPFNHLEWALIDLEQNYLDCPTFEPGQKKPARPLCDTCKNWPPESACL